MKRIFLALFLTVLSGCHVTVDNDFEPLAKACLNSSHCDESAIINSRLFNKTKSSNYTIDHAVISDNCLEIEITAAACSGENWEVALVDSGKIAESNPVQRYVRVFLENPEDCKTQITKTVTFDISCLQTQGNSLLLNLSNWEDPLQYNY